MFKCKVCDTELPDGAVECPNCRVHQEPPAKYEHGAVVKMDIGDEWYYNFVVDSYYNHEINMRMYRLNERMAMPVYREDWLEPVSDEEIDLVNKSGKLKPQKNGGWHYPMEA